MAGWKAQLTLVLALLALLAWRSVSLAQPADAPAGEKLAYSMRDLTVQVTSYHGKDIAAEGYGFVVGQQGDMLTIVTADHVVRDPEKTEEAEYSEVRVVFYSDQTHPQTADVLDLRLPPAYGDLAVLEVRKRGFRMSQPPVAQFPLTPGERAWRVGRQREWTPGDAPGAFTGTERTIWLGFDNLDTPKGSSGRPIVVAQGLVGMVTADQSGRALVLPINIIANFFREKGLPWGLNGSPQAGASPSPTSPAQSRVISGVASVWRAYDVGFPPWTLTLKADGAALSGTVRQGARDRSGERTTLTMPVAIYDGRINGDEITFRCRDPGNNRTITFIGIVNGDEITFTRAVLVRPRRDPGENGIFGASGAARFTAQQVAPSGSASGTHDAKP